MIVVIVKLTTFTTFTTIIFSNQPAFVPEYRNYVGRSKSSNLPAGL
jgi:hypothetical protein